MNIDKDIKIVKEMVIKSRDLREEEFYKLIGIKQIQAISNVVSELEIKDKMIDLMAEYLADIDFDECCAEIPEPCLSCSWEDYEPHTNCIKEYFRKKVKKDDR